MQETFDKIMINQAVQKDPFLWKNVRKSMKIPFTGRAWTGSAEALNCVIILVFSSSMAYM